MSEEDTKAETRSRQRTRHGLFDREASERPELEELTNIVSRLVHAHLIASTDLVSNLIQIHGHMLDDAVVTIEKPLHSAVEKRREGGELPFAAGPTSESIIDADESVGRSIRDIAEVVDRSVRRFWDEYNKR
jgi:hypothetical protein